MSPQGAAQRQNRKAYQSTKGVWYRNETIHGYGSGRKRVNASVRVRCGRTFLGQRDRGKMETECGCRAATLRKRARCLGPRRWGQASAQAKIHNFENPTVCGRTSVPKTLAGIESPSMLTLYRRHRKNCDHRNAGRTYRRCRCPIWVDGFIGNQEIRKSTDLRDWDKAQILVRE
jgi:hypothetical protein